MTITYRSEYSGRVDGERVAWMYRAYDDIGAPYVLVLDDGEGPLPIVQAPTEMLDGVPGDTEDRENAIDWVHRLTELVEKAKAYNEIFDDIEDGLVEVDGFHDLHVVEDDDESNLDAADGTNWDWDRAKVKAKTWLPSVAAYTVDELTDAETDQEWVDTDGDHYKYINDEWYISFDGWRPWASTEGGDSLTAYGPYTAVAA